MRLYIGLVHYPVYNKNREKIASAVTNLDLHDLSRLSRTYGVNRYFVITPLSDQRELTERLIDHWKTGFGASYNIDRKEAIKVIKITSSLNASIEEIKKIESEEPVVVATCASKTGRIISFAEAKDLINSDSPVFLLFGTAWGLHSEVLEAADFVLAPIEGNSDYNHLSVRTAAAIILDRLIGRYY
ncbi:RNA methyltransferase [Thermodesulfobacteriota bacterium]